MGLGVILMHRINEPMDAVDDLVGPATRSKSLGKRIQYLHFR